jgi:hypothetical protein
VIEWSGSVGYQSLVVMVRQGDVANMVSFMVKGKIFYNKLYSLLEMAPTRVGALVEVLRSTRLLSWLAVVSCLTEGKPSRSGRWLR